MRALKLLLGERYNLSMEIEVIIKKHCISSLKFNLGISLHLSLVLSCIGQYNADSNPLFLELEGSPEKAD